MGNRTCTKHTFATFIFIFSFFIRALADEYTDNFDEPTLEPTIYRSVVQLSGTKTSSLNQKKEKIIFFGFIIKSPSDTKTRIITSERSLVGLTDVSVRRINPKINKIQVFKNVTVIAHGQGVDVAILEITHPVNAISRKDMFRVSYVSENLPNQVAAISLNRKLAVVATNLNTVNSRSASYMGAVGIVQLPNGISLYPGSPIVNATGEIVGIYSSKVKAGNAEFGVYTHMKEARDLYWRIKRYPEPPVTIEQWNQNTKNTWYRNWYEALQTQKKEAKINLLYSAVNKNRAAYPVKYELALMQVENADYFNEEQLNALEQLLYNVETYVPADPGLYIVQAGILKRLKKAEEAAAKLRWVKNTYPQYLTQQEPPADILSSSH